MTLLAIPVAALGYCGTSSYLGAVLVFSLRVTVVRVIVSGAWLFPLDAALMSVDLVFRETVGIELSLKDRFLLLPIPSPKTITPDSPTLASEQAHAIS